MVKFSVVDRHRFDADSDPNFHVDADRHQNDADPHADPTSRFPHVGKSKYFLLQLDAGMPVYNTLSFSSVSNVVIIFSFF
jgi:hypothetical protein